MPPSSRAIRDSAFASVLRTAPVGRITPIPHAPPATMTKDNFVPTLTWINYLNLRFLEKNRFSGIFFLLKIVFFQKKVSLRLIFRNGEKIEQKLNAGVVKLVDTLDLGSSAARLGGSSPSTRTF